MRVKFYYAAWPDLPKMENGFLKCLKEKFGAITVDSNPDIIFYENRAITDEAALCKIFITGENSFPENFKEFDLILGFKEHTNNSYLLPFWTFCVNWDTDATDEWSVAKLISSPRVLSNQNRERFCGFISCKPRAYRISFVQKLSNYRNVTCAGKVLNNHSPIGGSRNDKKSFFQTCKFAIAFENEGTGPNDDLNGYVTEKIIDAFVADAIPIYWGDPTITKVFNPKAFLNRHDFDSDESFIEAIVKIDQNDELYQQMLCEPIFVNNEIPQSFYPTTVSQRIVEMYNKVPRITFYYGATKRIDVTRICEKLFVCEMQIIVPANVSFNFLFGDVEPFVAKHLVIKNHYNSSTVYLPEQRVGDFVSNILPTKIEK